jgi:hypothetical protein
MSSYSRAVADGIGTFQLERQIRNMELRRTELQLLFDKACQDAPYEATSQDWTNRRP